jgi:hypothetical protein
VSGHATTSRPRRWPWLVPVGATAAYVYAGWLDASWLLWAPAVLAGSAVGALLAVRRPRNPIGWIYLVMMGLGAAAAYGFAAVDRAGDPGTVPLTAALIGNAIVTPNTLGTTALVLLLFPSGRPPSRRWRPVVVVLIASALVVALATALLPGPLRAVRGYANPLGVGGLEPALEVVLAVGEGLLALLALGVIASTVARFRSARGIERQQLKLLGYAAMTMLVALAYAAARDPAQHADGAAVVALAWGTFPLAVGVAITRHRLYDIDRVINRTVVYVTVTGVLIAAYAGFVVLLQQLLRPVAGSSDLAVAASTLTVAAMFGPVRHRVQGLVDRRFDRARYDAARTVADFGARLRDEVDLDTLAAELRDTAARTVSPRHTSIWLAATGVGGVGRDGSADHRDVVSGLRGKEVAR